VTLTTPMPLIELAMEGKIAFLRAISGVPDEEEPRQNAATGNGPLDLMAHLRRRAQGT
jgi:hypothetical protein